MKFMNALLEIPETESINSQTAVPEPRWNPAGLVSVRKRILIVDDDALVRASLKAVLDCEGYEVYDVEDGNAAIRSAAEFQPDLVLLDLNTPTMDGWSAFAKLEDQRPLIPFIVITARPHQYKSAVQLGVDAFMEKPLNIPVLLRAIQKLTHEPEERHTRRITRHTFVTRLLDSATLC